MQRFPNRARGKEEYETARTTPRTPSGTRATPQGCQRNAGISIPYLSDLERGRTNPSLETLQTLAGAYGISVHDLLVSVEFYGEVSQQSLPKGLADLISDPVLGQQITPDWISSLSRIELRGKRPQTKEDWYDIFRNLKRILE